MVVPKNDARTTTTTARSLDDEEDDDYDDDDDEGGSNKDSGINLNEVCFFLNRKRDSSMNCVKLRFTCRVTKTTLMMIWRWSFTIWMVVKIAKNI